MTITKRLIPETAGNPYRLGRHVRHDERSRAFAVSGGATIRSVFHKPNNLMALDQGSIGACCGFSAVKCLSTEPFGFNFSNKDGISVYSDATKIDPYPGAYPPVDTGSDGVSVMQVCKQRGYISGYRWAFTLDQALSALMSGPGICGIEWRDGMFYPDARGRIRPVSSVAGGHELTLLGYDAANEELIIQNSWGPDWGIVEQGATGCCRMRIDDFSSLLATGGDVTFPNLP